jgi:hypothetical protein
LVEHQCRFVHGGRRLERRQGSEWFAIHRCAVRQLDLFVDVRRFRRDRNAVRYGLREFACAYRLNQRGSKFGGERNKLDAHLVRRECDGLYGIGRMGRQ